MAPTCEAHRIIVGLANVEGGEGALPDDGYRMVADEMGARKVTGPCDVVFALCWWAPTHSGDQAPLVALNAFLDRRDRLTTPCGEPFSG